LKVVSAQPVEASNTDAPTGGHIITPLIAFTDQLIDEIVYRLYGLTEAEIKIVSIRGCNSSMVRVA
jgi:hypothetical protein